MAGLVPAIHDLIFKLKFVDARHFGRACQILLEDIPDSYQG